MGAAKGRDRTATPSTLSGEDINGPSVVQTAHLSRPFLCATVLLQMVYWSNGEGGSPGNNSNNVEKKRDKLNKIGALKNERVEYLNGFFFSYGMFSKRDHIDGYVWFGLVWVEGPLMQWRRQRNRNWQSDGQSNVDSMHAILVLIKLIRYVYYRFFVCGPGVCFIFFQKCRYNRQIFFQFILKSELVFRIGWSLRLQLS